MEYGFELALCAALERQDRVVARQLGAAVADPGSRVMDVCLLEPGPAFDRRTAITDETIPPTAIEADVGPGTAVPVREAFGGPPERRTDTVDAACDVGYLTRERRDGEPCVRTTTRYPDRWFDRLVGVENKPDLGTPGDLDAQLRFDAALGLFDEVVLATASYVTRAHLNRIPDPVGVWRFDPKTGDREVVREAEPLAPDEPGVEIREERPVRTDVATVSPAAKARKRRRIAERTYGKGWRPEPPACERADVLDDGRPWCSEFETVVDPASDCAGCSAREDGEPPACDPAMLRDERTAWTANPDGTARRQVGLDRFP